MLHHRWSDGWLWTLCEWLKTPDGALEDYQALTTYTISMLGSLTLYRRLLLENVFSKPHLRQWIPFSSSQNLSTLPSFGHGIAGIMAGTTVSFIAAPVEHIKARLQIQYAADKSKRMYSGPIDCLRKMVSPQRQ